MDFRDDGEAEINSADDIRCEEKSIEYLLSGYSLAGMHLGIY